MSGCGKPQLLGVRVGWSLCFAVHDASLIAFVSQADVYVSLRNVHVRLWTVPRVADCRSHERHISLTTSNRFQAANSPGTSANALLFANLNHADRPKIPARPPAIQQNKRSRRASEPQPCPSSPPAASSSS